MYILVRKALLRFLIRPSRETLSTILESALIIILASFSVIARFVRKKIDIGLGPEPLINNISHKRSLESAGYTAETFVNQVYFITSKFDVRGDKLIWPFKVYLNYFLFAYVLFRYKCLYVYFNGGPLGFTRFHFCETFLLNIAGIRTVVMPYGGDVHDMALAKNLLFKHAMSADYPHFHRRKDRVSHQTRYWTRNATHVISGCDWVYYMYHWHTLMLGHFSIDLPQLEQIRPLRIPNRFSRKRPLRLFHAPNHMSIKGTAFFVKAVEALRRDGLFIDLVIKRGVPNTEILSEIQQADLVLDQLVIGWYAMFALEAMSLGRPVVCYLADDLLDLYSFAELVVKEEIPIINANTETIYRILREIYYGKIKLRQRASDSRLFAEKHHSIRAVGQKFAEINRSIGIKPSKPLCHD